MDKSAIEPRKYKWITILERQRIEFRRLLQYKSNREKYFNESFLKSISDEYRKSNRTLYRSFAIYSLLMVTICFAQSLKDSEIKVWGFKISNLSNYKEFMLLCSTAISFYCALLGPHINRLKMIVDEYVKFDCKDSSIRDFYKERWVSNYGAAFSKPNMEKGYYDHRIIDLIRMSIVVILIFLGVFVLLFQLFVQAYVIYDLIRYPILDEYVSHIIVGISITLLIASWTLSCLSFPLPEINMNYYKELDQIRNFDENIYRDFLRKYIKRKKIIRRIFDSIFLFLFFNVVMFFRGGFDQYFSNNEILTFSMVAAFKSILYAFWCGEVIRWIEKGVNNLYLSKYDKRSSELNVKIYKIITKFKYINFLTVAILMYSFMGV